MVHEAQGRAAAKGRTLNERGIIFGAESIANILPDGRRKKTQTRRLVKLQPVRRSHMGPCRAFCWEAYGYQWLQTPPPEVLAHCPYGPVGRRLWCRETWRTVERRSDCVDGILFADLVFRPIENTIEAADNWGQANCNNKYGDNWRSPLFMPRWASRIDLEVSSVGLERLQDISEEDARAEGMDPCPYVRGGSGDMPGGCPCRLLDSPRPFACSYAQAWDALNGHKKGAAWDDNPWVWVVGFRRTKSC